MAKIVEDVVVIKFSRIVRDDAEQADTLVNSEIRAALEGVAQELAGEHVVVEVLDAH